MFDGLKKTDINAITQKRNCLYYIRTVPSCLGEQTYQNKCYMVVMFPLSLCWAI